MKESKIKCDVGIDFEIEEKYDQYVRVSLLLGGRAVGDVEIDGCEIARIHVRDAFRGRGFGRIALSKALAIANENGCDEATLKSIPESVGFFKKHGFIEVGKEDIYTVMTKKLKPAWKSALYHYRETVNGALYLARAEADAKDIDIIETEEVRHLVEQIADNEGVTLGSYTDSFFTETVENAIYDALAWYIKEHDF